MCNFSAVHIEFLYDVEDQLKLRPHICGKLGNPNSDKYLTLINIMLYLSL